MKYVMYKTSVRIFHTGQRGLAELEVLVISVINAYIFPLVPFWLAILGFLLQCTRSRYIKASIKVKLRTTLYTLLYETRKYNYSPICELFIPGLCMISVGIEKNLHFKVFISHRHRINVLIVLLFRMQ